MQALWMDSSLRSSHRCADVTDQQADQHAVMTVLLLIRQLAICHLCRQRNSRKLPCGLPDERQEASNEEPEWTTCSASGPDDPWQGSNGNQRRVYLSAVRRPCRGSICSRSRSYPGEVQRESGHQFGHHNAMMEAQQVHDPREIRPCAM